MITELSRDEALEVDIEYARQLIMTGQTVEVRRTACALMAALIAARSPERVREMTEIRGLNQG